MKILHEKANIGNWMKDVMHNTLYSIFTIIILNNNKVKLKIALNITLQITELKKFDKLY